MKTNLYASTRLILNFLLKPLYLQCCLTFKTFSFFSFSSFVCVCVCVCPHPWHMEVPRLGVESELQLQVYAKATAMPDPNHMCDLNSNSQQCWILNLLSKARDQAHVLMDTSRIRYLWATRGMSIHSFHPFVFSWPLYSWNWQTHTQKHKHD